MEIQAERLALNDTPRPALVSRLFRLRLDRNLTHPPLRHEREDSPVYYSRPGFAPGVDIDDPTPNGEYDFVRRHLLKGILGYLARARRALCVCVRHGMNRELRRVATVLDANTWERTRDPDRP